MIFGIGIDLVKIKRLERFQEKNKLDALIKRVLNDEEINRFNSPEKQVNDLAKRFAAKEALSKALGVGISKKFGFKDVSILHDKRGKPIFKAKEKLQNWLDKENLNLFLSLSDEKDFLVAMVVIEKS